MPHINGFRMANRHFGVSVGLDDRGEKLSMLLLVVLLAGGAPVPSRNPDDDCYTVWSATGSAHPITAVCPARQKRFEDTIRRMTENGKRAGTACAGGMASLRNGGNVDRLEDYECPGVGRPSSDKERK